MDPFPSAPVADASCVKAKARTAPNRGAAGLFASLGPRAYPSGAGLPQVSKNHLPQSIRSSASFVSAGRPTAIMLTTRA